MKCNRYVPGTQIIVDAIWEVRLENGLWSEIVRASQVAGKTYSWVVRWCIFTALEPKNLEQLNATITEFHNSKSIGASSKETHHRLQLCLYGEDQYLFKACALKFRVSVTSLIRAAIRMYLDQILSGSISHGEFISEGLKHIKSAITEFRNSSYRLDEIKTIFQHFPRLPTPRGHSPPP